MTTTNEDIETIPQLFYQALLQVMHANTAHMLALWSEQDDVTYSDPNGHPRQGRNDRMADSLDFYVPSAEALALRAGTLLEQGYLQSIKPF
jgi:hypothetical protein